MFTCNKKKGEGVEGKKGEEKKAVVYRGGRRPKAYSMSFARNLTILPL